MIAPPATLAGLLRRPCDPLLLAVRGDGRPLHGMTGRLDWYLASWLSDLVRAGRVDDGRPLLVPGGPRLPVSRLILWKVGATAPGRVAELARALGTDRLGFCAADFGWSPKAVSTAFGATPVILYG